jgi:hypothetical protein
MRLPLKRAFQQYRAIDGYRNVMGGDYYDSASERTDLPHFPKREEGVCLLSPCGSGVGGEVRSYCLQLFPAVRA